MRKFALLLTLLLSAAVMAGAADISALKPPKGARVAIVVFEDLQCPDCARAWPLLQEAAKTYKIPIVHYDFPLPMHNWSYQAAINAHFFDSKSAKLGEEYRTYLFAHQIEITPQNLREFTEKFAQKHQVVLPFVVDPRGEFEKQVKQSYALGQRTGIQHTPTIYIVSNSQRGKPFVEVVDRTQLYALIDDMLKQAGPAPASEKPARKPNPASPKS